MPSPSAQFITFKADPAVIRQAKELARERDMTVSQIMRHLLRRELEASQRQAA